MSGSRRARQAMVALWPRNGMVMVDLAALDATAVAALQLAGLVVLVMTDDLCSVQTAQQTLGLLPALGVDRERIGVALCHVRPTADIPVETIQKALRRPLAAEIPYQAEQMAAIRRGVPLAAAEPDGLYAQALSALEQVCGRRKGPARRRRTQGASDTTTGCLHQAALSVGSAQATPEKGQSKPCSTGYGVTRSLLAAGSLPPRAPLTERKRDTR